MLDTLEEPQSEMQSEFSNSGNISVILSGDFYTTTSTLPDYENTDEFTR